MGAWPGDCSHIPFVTQVRGGALITLICGAFESSNCGGGKSPLTPLRESSPQSRPSCARLVQAQGTGTFRGCHHSLHGAAIRLSHMRLVGRAFVLHSGKSCSIAQGRPRRPRNDWAARSTRRTARNVRGLWRAAGYTGQVQSRCRERSIATTSPEVCLASRRQCGLCYSPGLNRPSRKRL